MFKKRKIDFGKEALIALVVMAVYAVVAFYRLGSTKAPQTYWQADSDGRWFTIDFDKPQTVRHIYSFMGMGDEYTGHRGAKTSCDIDIFVPENGEWKKVTTLEHDYVFTWKNQDITFTADRVMLVANREGRTLNELVLTDGDGNIISGQLSDSSAVRGNYLPCCAVDESETLPHSFDEYYYSTYFDEVYHARTAYEIIHGYSEYESTHPPLGKEIIGVGIRLFGMTPFGWRIMGAVSGILMLPAIYVLVWQLFKNRRTALLAMVLMALDFMHLTQTRVATVDSFVVLFTLLMFVFMAGYADAKTPGSEMVCLLASGVFMGMCVAVKWNGAYGAMGLAIYFFTILYKKCVTATKKADIKKAAVTMGWCVVCFVAVPCAIYFASFMPLIGRKGGSMLQRFINYQQNMLHYHSSLVAEHFFASPWYSWLADYKPMWYAVSRYNGMTSSISAFGNPLLWLAFPVCVVLCCAGAVKRNDDVAFVTVVGYFTCLLPWVAVTRLAFIYHYFPATIFGIMAVVWVLDGYTDGFTDKKKNRLVLIYVAALLVCFAVFFPVVTGVPARTDYIERLEILPSWYFN